MPETVISSGSTSLRIRSKVMYTAPVGVFSKPFTLCFKTLEQLYAQLRKGRHGVVLTVDGKSSGFVPSFWRHYETPEEFMAALCSRSGKTAAVLLEPSVEVAVFEEHVCREKGKRQEFAPRPIEEKKVEKEAFSQ